MNRFLVLAALILLSPSLALASHLKFVQITDAHVSLDGENYRNRDISSSLRILDNAVKSINAMPDIDFVVFSGDNIDSANQESLHAFCQVVSRLNMPYFVGIGNHDVAVYQHLDKKRYLDIVRLYNKNQKSNKPSYYFRPNNDFIVIVVDGANEVIPGPHGYYRDETLKWLDKVLTANDDKKAIIVQHFPIIPPKVNKSHVTVDPEKYAKILSAHKNVVAVLSGHYHVAKEIIQDGVYHESTPALIVAPHSYNVFDVNYEKHNFTEGKADIELKVKQVDLEPKEQNQPVK